MMPDSSYSVNMITSIRMTCQQLATPLFDSPKDLVNWMGAVQAQDPAMARWAVGIRTRGATERNIRESLDRGDILRTHIMRPTWHLVSAEDIRWMLSLTGHRIRSANLSFGKQHGVHESMYNRSMHLIEKILEGNNHLTKEEIGQELNKAGIMNDLHCMSRLMTHAETEGIVCSGIMKEGKHTFALLEERVPPAKELHKEEALALFAEKYFRSHSPASEEDFRWWSGLSASETRQAIASIRHSLIADMSGSRTLYIHASSSPPKTGEEILHLLPSFDEYLISYKNRTDTLDAEHRSKAFNNWGTFYPVIMYNGRIAGNWKKIPGKSRTNIQTTFFEPDACIPSELLEKAIIRYKTFLERP